jgi:hypothetical protein
MQAMATTQQAHPATKFKIDKVTRGEVTFLAMHGILDENFEGQRVVSQVRTKKLVVSLREVRRFASWGMAEWMNFLRATSEHDLYLVECSTYAINQMNLVTGLLGHGKLVSFYMPYRCGSCGEEFEIMMLVPRDRGALRELADTDRACATCGGSARVDKYPATMCTALADRPAFDMDDEVVEFLRDQLRYELTPDVARFRAFRRVSKGNVYLRLTGNITALPIEPLAKASEGTTIVDLAQIIFDPMDVNQWRTYLRTALASVGSLQLLDCPVGFLERGVRPEDLEAKLKVRTFALQYLCPTCNTVGSAMVDVAEHLEQLTEGMVPTAYCPTCQSSLVARTADSALLRRLPAREHDAALDAFLAKARALPPDKLDDCLAVRPARRPAEPGGVPRSVYIGSALAALAIAGLAVALFIGRQTPAPVLAPSASAPVVPPAAGSAFQRPEWIMSDVPSSSFCQDMLNRLVCIGVSPYLRTKEEAANDASDAALEELVNAISLKITDPVLRDGVLPGASDARSKALSALQAVDTDRRSAAYAAADDVVRKALHRVVAVLKASGGAAVPARRSDWYWEEYAADKGGGTEFLVFVRYDVSLDAVKALAERYTAPSAIGTAQLVTAFPGLAWQYAEFAGGAMVTKLGGPLTGPGVAAQSIVTAVGDQRVVDAGGLARRIDDTRTGPLAVMVVTGGAPAQKIELRR